MERKKTSLLIIGISILLLSAVGVTYAFWQLRLFQIDEDRLASSCFNVTFSEEEGSAINLQKAYPIPDEEGKELSPYTFTITNVCPTSLTYQVNLETLSLEEGQKPLPEQYIKVQLDERTPSLLNSYASVTKTLENATASHRLTTGILDGEHKSVTHHLRLWLDEDTPAIDAVMNAYFKSKITVTATYKSNEQLQNEVSVLAKSNTEAYNEESESITLTATSEKYDLTEYKISERKETQNWKPMSKKDKTFTVTETFTKAGTYYFTVKDEVGNEKEQEFEVTKIDTSGPNISYTETNNYQSVELKITMKDTQSGLVKYQITKENLSPIALLSESTPEPPESWTEIENTKEEQVITKTIEDNGVYYIFAQDAMGHTSSMKYSTDIIDKNPPTIELSSELSTWGESDTIHISLSDSKAGLFGYQVMKEEKDPESWETVENNPKSHSIDYTVTENGTYYIYAKDAYNNITHNSIEIKWVDTNSPVANLTLSLDGKTIIVDASESTDTESNIVSYEYKLDDSEEWTSGDNSHEFSVPKYGDTHKVTLRVKDEANHISEASQTIYIGGPAIDVIKDVEVVTTGNGLYAVPHDDEIAKTMDEKWQETEYRFAGVDYKTNNNDYVHNYIWFNCEDGYTSGADKCERWQIIGLVNVKVTKEDGNEGIEQRLKIIKDDKLTSNMKWDENDQNDWTKASLMTYLNSGEYYKTQLKDNAKGMIDENIIWNIGGWSTRSVTTPVMYGYERGTKTGNSDAYPAEWKKDNTIEGTDYHSIALPYASDYGYATNGGSIGRDKCFSQVLNDWGSGSYKTDCAGNDWLKPTSGYMWLLSPNSPYSDDAFYVYSPGDLSIGGVVGFNSVWPALYLSSKVTISSGTGGWDQPYILNAEG